MKLGANLRYIKKQISKKFSKFARPLLIVLTLVGMISAVAFTNFSQETQTSADSWNTPSPVAGYIGANGVHLVKTIPDGRAFAFYNLWDDPQTRVAVHPNNTDYSLHSDFYLDTYSWVENHYDSVDVNNNGDIVIADYDAGDLLVYDVYYDGDTASLDGIDYYPIPEDPEGSGQVFARYDDSNNNIYVITNSQLVVYYSGDYANPDVYALDSIGTVSAELDETNDYLYITADDYFYRYDTGAFPSFQYYDLLNDNSGLHDYLQISPDGERVFIRSSNTSKVYEYDVTTWNPIIVQEYDLSGWETRFKVNDDFLYSYSWSKVARWSRSDPEDILDSGDVENVAIRNIDLVGDDVLALSFWYRELYLYDLEVEPEGDLGEEDCDFPYVWNDPKCERYVYSSSLHINTDEGEDVSIASTYNKQDNFYAVLNWNEGDYPAGSINVNGDIYELNYDTNDYMLSSYMVPAPGGVFISLVGLGDNAQILYFEYPSGNISLYPMPFFGTVGLSINDDGDLLMWEEYGYDYAVAPNDGGFPDFDNLFTSSATEPLSTKGGFIVNGGDVIFQMYSGDVIYAISAASGYTEEDFIDLSGVLGSIEITVKSKPGGYDLYVAGYTSGPTELHIKPYTGCELDAPFSSCTEEDPIVMPYGAPIYSISSLLIDEDDNIFFAGSNNGEIGRVLQSNKAVEFFSLTDLNDSIISYDLDNYQNLYVTSSNYIYERHDYYELSDDLPTGTAPSFVLGDAESLHTALEGYWRLDEESYPTAYDSSGNKRNGNIMGGVLSNQSVFGPRALELNGGNDHVDMGTVNLGMTGDHAFTISAWVRPHSYVNDGCILSYGEAATSRVLSLCTSGSGNVYVVHYGNDQTYSTQYDTGSWQHIVISYNPTTGMQKLYKNGMFMEELSIGSLDLQSSGTLQIGRAFWNGTVPNDMDVDEVRLYSRELSLPQIQSLYDINILSFKTTDVAHFVGSVFGADNFFEGNVELWVDGSEVASASVSINGYFDISYTFPSANIYEIVLKYSGDPTYAPSEYLLGYIVITTSGGWASGTLVATFPFDYVESLKVLDNSVITAFGAEYNSQPNSYYTKHTNPSDYNDFDIQDTGLGKEWIADNPRSIEASDDGWMFYVYNDSEQLRIFDDAGNEYTYNYDPGLLGAASFVNVAYNNIDDELYVSTDEYLTIFYNVHTGDTNDISVDQYTHPIGDWTTDIEFDPVNGYIYVTPNFGQVMRYNINDNYNVGWWDIWPWGADCPNNLEIRPDGTRVFFTDECGLSEIFEFSTESGNMNFVGSYQIDEFTQEGIEDFAVTDNFIYALTFESVIRFQIGSGNFDAIVSQIIENVHFNSVDVNVVDGTEFVYALDSDPGIWEFEFVALVTELSETHIIGMSWSSNPSPDGAPALIAGEELLIDVEVYDPINPGSIPTGYVALRMDDVLTVLDILELDENGMVTFSIRPNPGFHFVHAYYLGDDTYDTSQSVNHTLRVYSIATFTTLETSQNPVVKGDSFTLTAHVELPNYTIPDDSPVEFSGYVRFAVGTIDLGWELVDLNGDVSITVNTSDNPVSNLNLNEGVHHIRAHYLPFWDGFNPWLRVSSSETLFQSVVESGEGGESSEGSDIPPEGGEGGASDFAASIKGRDKVTGSISETKIGSILEWVMDYNNLGPNSNAAVTYFPIRENQEFVVGSIQAPPNWIITYSQDQTCDESTFTYTPVGADGTTDPAMRCVRFQNDRVNVPPTRSDLRYITTAADFSELNVASLGGIDVYKVVPYNNKVFYFNHHWTVTRMEVNPTKTMFCFDLEINDTCVSQNPNIVYPLSLGLNGWADKDDEYISSKTSFGVNAEVVGDKLYIPMTDMNSPDPDDNGHGFMCWDLSQDYYCNTPGFTRGAVSLNTTAFNAWGWGNIGDIEYNPDMQELYATSVGPNEGRMVILCFSLVTNTPCVGQPYELGTFTGYDPGYGSVKYQASTGRIYSTSGGNVGNMDRQIQCLIASTKEICPDFPEGGVQILPNKRNQQIFYNANNDQICAMLYSDHEDFGPTSPRIYCYDLDAETFYDYLPNMDETHFANEMFHDLSDQYPGRLYYMAKWDDTVIMCWDIETGEQCEGWEDGIASNIAPFDDKIYTFYYAFDCMWAASDSGRVFTFDPITGGTCNPLITLTQGNVAVTLNGEGMFCDTDPEDVTWNKVKVVDTGVTPSPAILNATVYDSTQCTTNEDNIVSCTGSPLMSGNLLLNSGHELDISSISYEEHPSLTAILEFQYPAVPEPAPGFYIELNPTNKAQMCADTKLVFTGALCANPITTVCENTNISYIEDPVSNNNSGQYCLNVETYFGKDPNSALCFVATTPDEDVFTVFNPDAVVAPPGTVVPFDPSQTYNRGDGSYSFGNGFFGFIEGFIEESIPQIITEEVIRETLSSVDTSTPLAVTAVTAVTTATVVATSAVAAGSGVGQIFGIFLGFLTPKRKKYWGVIVDELTSKPIAFASITLSVKAIGTDNQMNSTVVAQAVSDLDGRYRLNTDRRDEFYLEVKASGYQPFTKFIKMANPLASEEDIVYDVPLRRLDAKPNIFKQLINYRKKNLIGFARGVLLVSSVLGFIFTIYSQINFPTKLNWVLLVIYILVFVISFYPTIYQRIQKRGKVVDMDANLPIPGAVVRIYDEKQQIALSLTNNKGEARFDLPSGEYSILASKRGYIMISEEGKNLIKAVVKREGYLDRNILMRATAEAPAQPAAQGVLENPFS